MKYKKIITGLVIELPRNQEQHGVVLEASALSKGWYKVIVLCEDSDILSMKLKIKEDGEHLYYRCLHQFNTQKILTLLKTKSYTITF